MSIVYGDPPAVEIGGPAGTEGAAAVDADAGALVGASPPPAGVEAPPPGSAGGAPGAPASPPERRFPLKSSSPTITMARPAATHSRAAEIGASARDGSTAPVADSITPTSRSTSA